MGRAWQHWSGQECLPAGRGVCSPPPPLSPPLHLQGDAWAQTQRRLPRWVLREERSPDTQPATPLALACRRERVRQRMHDSCAEVPRVSSRIANRRLRMCSGSFIQSDERHDPNPTLGDDRVCIQPGARKVACEHRQSFGAVVVDMCLRQRGSSELLGKNSRAQLFVARFSILGRPSWRPVRGRAAAINHEGEWGVIRFLWFEFKHLREETQSTCRSAYAASCVHMFGLVGERLHARRVNGKTIQGGEREREPPAPDVRACVRARASRQV